MKSAAQRKADQRRREDALAQAHMLRLPRIAVPESVGDYLRSCGFLSATAEDDPVTLARGVEAMIVWLIEHADDQPLSR